MKKDKTKEFLLKKMTEKWMKENKGILDDYYKICHDILMFKAMWGIEIGIILNNPKEDKGRQLGIGAEIDELFEAQKFTKKSK